MKNNDELFKQYESAVKQILKLHIQKYFEEYQEARTLETATEYMNKHYERYRKHIIELYLNFKNESNPSKEIHFNLIQYTKDFIGLLFSEIMFESRTYSAPISPLRMEENFDDAMLEKKIPEQNHSQTNETAVQSHLLARRKYPIEDITNFFSRFPSVEGKP
jgi:hypothetical protein